MKIETKVTALYTCKSRAELTDMLEVMIKEAEKAAMKRLRDEIAGILDMSPEVIRSTGGYRKYRSTMSIKFDMIADVIIAYDRLCGEETNKDKQ